ncbi:DDE superfamily endonuclease containing protein [Tritrichomonas foetus]|uniref:DDE superfamily endonuclease containing protein n=1 Tax=Tritrichomonas foetus TaxID=1144522 RepID=A0A1J4JCV1_9EUKA|nr:DDE superfamily endonuclease containing protein [Tritrichomonas foetus]|eukprot:OHS95491.1 DDE superfamily endonuclease containing protein [Tritrichomonas foetus]
MTISADGYSLPRFIILQKLKKLPPELGDLVGRAHFSTSKNGWIAKKLFYVWCVYFVNMVSKYRVEVLPPHLRNIEMVLFVDSHNNRLCSEALTFLEINKIRLITLLAHSSHLTQLFDKNIASPFKNALAQYFSLRDTKYLELDNNGVSYMRRLLIFSVIDAWQVATCRSSVMKAFRDTGIFPFLGIRDFRSAGKS